MNKENTVTVAILVCSILLGVLVIVYGTYYVNYEPIPKVHADSYHIDNTRVGKELTVTINTWDIINHHYTRTSEDVTVEFGGEIKSCHTNRYGFCAIPFKLRDEHIGQNNVTISTEDNIYNETVWVLERSY